MAFSVENLFKLRKFPFFFALSLLLICFTILLFTNKTTTFNTIVYYSDVQLQPRPQPSSPVLENSNRDKELLREETPTTDPSIPELPREENTITGPKDVELPPIENTVSEQKDVQLPPIEKPITKPKDVEIPRIENPITELKDEELVQKDETFEMDWKLCKGDGSVDYIPCLDNLKAIKALKTRRHMEHRERHCPNTNPHCLVRLPKGYKVPVPWPKSRDMVRLIVW